MDIKSKLHYHLSNFFGQSICPSGVTQLTSKLQTVSPQASSRQMLALINPGSGRGKAKQQLKVVMPIFEKCNIRIKIAEIQGNQVFCETSTQPFVTFFQTLDLSCIDGIIVCGGDGTVHSVVNALMSRLDSIDAITIPIGILPCGTDNGLCKTILACSEETYSLANAALIIAKGYTRALDLFKISQPGKSTVYGVHSLTWGLVSDVDIRSNRLKFLGPLKEWIYGAFYVLRSKLYAGEVSFASESVRNRTSSNICHDQFIGLWAMNVPWAGKSWLTAPFAELNNGLIDLLIFRQGLSRRELVAIFLKMPYGSHIHCPNLEYYKTSSLTLKPTQAPCMMSIDGEPTEVKSIDLEVLRKSCVVFCSHI